MDVQFPMDSVIGNDSYLTLKDLGLDTPSHITKTFGPRIPFATFVKQSTVFSSQIVSKTFDYYALPVELQLMILDFCDAGSLFNLMHSCSDLRTRVKPLFWSQPDTFYFVQPEWINPDVYCRSLNLHFAREVQSVELDCAKTFLLSDYLRYLVTPEQFDVLRNDTEAMRKRAAALIWKHLLQTFPALKQVLCMDETAHLSPRLPPFFTGLQHFLDACPPGVTVLLCQWQPVQDLPHKGRWLWSHLYRWNGRTKELLNKSWKRNCVVPPRRNEYASQTVKKFMTRLWRTRDGSLGHRKTALTLLRMEATEKFHFGGGRNKPFQCPYYRCSLAFDRPRQYLDHLIEPVGPWGMEANRPSPHGIGIIHGVNYFSPLPDSIEIEIKALELQASQEVDEIWRSLQELKQYWGAEGTARRASFLEFLESHIKAGNMYKTDCEQVLQYLQ